MSGEAVGSQSLIVRAFEFLLGKPRSLTRSFVRSFVLVLPIARYRPCSAMAYPNQAEAVMRGANLASVTGAFMPETMNMSMRDETRTGAREKNEEKKTAQNV